MITQKLSCYIQRNYFPLLIGIFLLSILLNTSCRKENFTDNPSAKLNFTADTVHFDTVFVSVGSATRNFKVINPNKQGVKTTIYLAGGSASQFRINIDGRATTKFENYELAGLDSFFVFVEVTVDPKNLNQPFIVSDSIIFETNGNIQKVQLVAFGQDAHFFDGQYIGDTTWTNDKPYVIYRSIAVLPGRTLQIMQGVTIYSHAGSGIIVAGTLNVQGNKDNPVVFRGDRLEHAYDEEPGQWYGIRFLPKSQNNFIEHAIIKNGIVGIEVDSLPKPGNINLKLSKTIISNMTVAGLVCYTAKIRAENLLIHSCGQYTFVGDLGGDYDFTNCTFDNTVSNVSHRVPSLWLSNQDYKDVDGNVVAINDLHAAFRNCIIWGSLDEEIKFQRVGSGNWDTLFSHNIIKYKDLKFNNTNLNKNPLFINPSASKYALDTLSPAKDFGMYFSPPYLVTDDIEDQIRDSSPDAGAYERKE